MSADEIKALAQQAFVDGMANHHAGLLKTEARCKRYANALLSFAAMVERCENLLKDYDLYGSVSEANKLKADICRKHVNYILEGATDEGK